MHEQLKMMEEFHRAFGHPINEPGMINAVEHENDKKGWDRRSLDYLLLRKKLNEEECKELNDELIDCYQNANISPNLLKEGADLLYVLLGTFVSLGLGEKLIEAFKRVHESNMSKLDENGKPIYREDGKVLKSNNYKPPNLEDLI